MRSLARDLVLFVVALFSLCFLGLSLWSEAVTPRDSVLFEESVAWALFAWHLFLSLAIAVFFLMLLCWFLWRISKLARNHEGGPNGPRGGLPVFVIRRRPKIILVYKTGGGGGPRTSQTWSDDIAACAGWGKDVPQPAFL